MRTILWIPIGVFVLGTLAGAYFGGRSTTGSARTGATIGAFLSLMSTFPLLAIGLSTS